MKITIYGCRTSDSALVGTSVECDAFGVLAVDGCHRPARFFSACNAQARALQSNQEYVLPVRFDDTEIPGLRPTIAYVNAQSYTPGKTGQPYLREARTKGP
jgi:hypothetical protein